MVSSTLSPVAVQPRPTVCHTQTVRRGAVVDAECRVRWVKRPESRPMGWRAGILEIDGKFYHAEAQFVDDSYDDAEVHFLMVDLRQTDGTHYRLILGQGQQTCDCPHSVYRGGAEGSGIICKHRAAVTEALDQLEALERAEWEAAVAASALAAVEVPF